MLHPLACLCHQAVPTGLQQKQELKRQEEATSCPHRRSGQVSPLSSIPLRCNDRVMYRRCPSGEGVHQFLTNHGVEIVRGIKKAVANLSVIKSSGDLSWTRSSNATRSGSSVRSSGSCSHASCRRARSPTVLTDDRRDTPVSYTPILVNRTAEEASIVSDEGYINDELLHEY